MRKTSNGYVASRTSAPCQNSPSRDRSLLQTVLSRFEGVCLRLENAIETQTLRLNNIESCLSTALTGKFDMLVKAVVSSAASLKILQGHCQPQSPTQNANIETKNKLVSVKNIDAASTNSPASHPTTKQLFNKHALSVLQVENPYSSETIHNPPTKEAHGCSIQVIEHLRSNPEASIRSTIGKMMARTTEAMYKKLCSNELDEYELKAKFGWKVLNQVMELTSSLQTSEQHQQTSPSGVVAIIDSSLRNSLEFLIHKYPPSRHKVVDTELGRSIGEIKRHTELQHDVLRNAGVSFTMEKLQYAAEIKHWINRLIGEVRATYPRFKDDMKILFRGYEGSTTNEYDEDVEYEIGAKIPQTTELYSEQELESAGLVIKNPQISRVLTKWTEQLMRMLLKPEETLEQYKGGFKSATTTTAIYLTKAMRAELANCIRSIAQEKLIPKLEASNRQLLIGVQDVFTVVESGLQEAHELDHKEIVCLKTAQFLHEYNNVYTTEILNALLECLNTVRRRYPPERIESTLDLVSCNILDILRCKCIGSKKDIKRIYQGLQQHKQYEIIRVKVKLNQSTRDILINFRSRESFLVCEMQLALGSKDSLNESFCHYLYELQRSTVPVVFEIAGQLIRDSRMGYFSGLKDAVKFNLHPYSEQFRRSIKFIDGALRCSYQHHPVQLSFIQNNKPYCCSLCSKFTGGMRDGLQFLRCESCRTTVCPRCALDFDSEMQRVYLERRVRWEKLVPFLGSNIQPHFAFLTESGLIEQLKRMLTSRQYLLLLRFLSTGVRLSVVKAADNEIVETFFTFYGRRLSSFNEECWVCIVALKQHEVLSLERISHYAKLTVNDKPWHVIEDSLMQAGKNTLIGVYHPQTKQVLVLDILESPAEIRSKLMKDSMACYIREESRKVQCSLELTSKQLIDTSFLDEVQHPQNVKTINIWGNQVRSLPNLKRFTNLTEVILRQNMFKSLESVLPLRKLRLLNLQKNLLSGSLPSIELPNLTLLDLSANQLTSVRSLEQASLPHLNTLYLSFNQLESLPVLNCPALEVYFFVSNRITSLTELTQSKLKQLKRVRAINNRIEGALPKLSFAELMLLHLEENSFTSIQALERSDLPRLEKLHLDKNCIVGALPILRMPKLHTLTLSVNKISSFGGIDQWLLPSLSQLNVSNNAIVGYLPTIALPQLKSLDLSHNHIEGINFKGMQVPCLTVLNLSNNQIFIVGMMRHYLLQTLDLSNNLIEDCSSLGECRLPLLSSLLLANNRIRGEMPVLQLPSLTDINLDGNGISKLTFLKERQLIPLLRCISMKRNELLCASGDLIILEGRDYCVSSNWLLRFHNEHE